MATNNILRVNESIGAGDQLTQVNYSGSTTRTDGIPEGLADRLFQNKINSQLAAVVVGISESMAANQETDIEDTLAPAQMQVVFENSIKGITRKKATADKTFYVDEANGTDSPTNGEATGADAWATIQYAVERIGQDWDGQGYNLTIDVADGNYTDQVSLEGSYFYAWSSVTISGNTTTPSNVALDAGSDGSAFFLSSMPLTTIEGFQLTCTGDGIQAQLCGRIGISDIDWDDIGGDCIQSNETKRTNISGSNNRINNDPNRFLTMRFGSIARFTPSFTVDLVGSPGFSTFIDLFDASHIADASNFSNTGSATGTRYTLTDVSSVTNAGSTTLFPGNVSGVVDANSVYQL